MAKRKSTLLRSEGFHFSKSLHWPGLYGCMYNCNMTCKYQISKRDSHQLLEKISNHRIRESTSLQSRPTPNTTSMRNGNIVQPRPTIFASLISQKVLALMPNGSTVLSKAPFLACNRTCTRWWFSQPRNIPLPPEAWSVLHWCKEA